jgi:hypothetical protein
MAATLGDEMRKKLNGNQFYEEILVGLAQGIIG